MLSGIISYQTTSADTVRYQSVTSCCCPVTAEAAGSSPVVPAIHSKAVNEWCFHFSLPTISPTGFIGRSQLRIPQRQGTSLEPRSSRRGPRPYTGRAWSESANAPRSQKQGAKGRIKVDQNSIPSEPPQARVRIFDFPL